MAFHNAQLPSDIERGAQGGPRFKTTILILGGGLEKRNIDWATTRAEYDISYGIESKADYSDVIEFFYARQGRAHSFRFKDWADFEITAQNVMTTDGSTSTVSMFKRYSSGGVNSVSQTVVYDTSPAATEVAINTTTGLITLGSTHAATSGQAVDITGEFDVPVRFDTDALDVNVETFDAGSMPQLTLVEVKGE
jgi:uncharacterized protein (TIGR02217 family)